MCCFVLCLFAVRFPLVFLIENFDLGGKSEPLEKSKHTAAGKQLNFKILFFLSNVCLTFSRLQISSPFFLRTSFTRGNLLTKFSKVSLAIKLGMKIWLEFVVWCFVLVLKIKTKRNGVPSLGFCCCCWEKVRFFKTKSLHLNTKAKNKRTANWNTDYIGARFAPKWGKWWDTLNERTNHLYLEGGDKIYQSMRCQLPCQHARTLSLVFYAFSRSPSPASFALLVLTLLRSLINDKYHD